MHTEFIVPNGVTMYWRSDVPTYTDTGEYQNIPLNYVHERIAEVKDPVS